MKKSILLCSSIVLLFLISCSTNKKGNASYQGYEDKAVLSLEDRLLRKAGVFIQSGEIRIRGGDQSFFASSEPLFEINGQIITGGFREASTLVNPVEIKSIRVLKNPDELAMYGARGLNGVIKIRLRNSQGDVD